MDEDLAISVKHLSKSFKLPHEKKSSLKEHVLNFRKQTFEEFKVLKDINFEIKKGEFFGIVGRNGSGKSTMLKILGGIYQPNKGEVKVSGTLTPFIELGIGFNPELTGRENVFLNGAILGLTRKEVTRKYDEIVEFAELDRFMDQKLKNYSSGMQVRLAFAIAIQAHNNVLLIDEVLAVGDSNFQRKCFKVFREIKESGKTVVFVTHDMGAIQEYCDRAMMIQDGEIVAIGSPRKIALRYEAANSSVGASVVGEVIPRPADPALKLTNVQVSAPDKKTKHFSLDDDIVVDVSFEVRREAPAQINLFFMRTDGVQSAGINTTNDLKKFAPKKGKHTIQCCLRAGQLVKGEYNVNVAAYTTDEVPDLIDIMDENYGTKTPLISVIERSAYQDGEFYIQGKWSV